MSTKKSNVAYLDGIRGIAAFCVFLNHFTLAFYPAYFTQNAAATHMDGWDLKYGVSYFSFFTNGGFCVQIFFVLSGFVLSRKYFKTNELEVAISGLHRRFLRLYIPIAFALLISFILKNGDFYQNIPVSRITLSDWFVKKFYIPEPAKQFLQCLIYRTMFLGDSSFDTSMWTISSEFYGSLFVFAFLVFTHFTRYRLPMMFIAMFFFFITDGHNYLPFVLGMTLCYTEPWIAKRKNALTTILAVLLLVGGLIFSSVPFCVPLPDTWQEQLKESFDYTPWCQTIAAYMLVVAYVLAPPLQKIVSVRPFRFLGYISFSLYLLHALILGSFSSWLFLRVYNNGNYHQAVLTVFAATVVLLISASWLMAKYVDQFGIDLAKRVYNYLRQAPDSSAKPAEAIAQPVDVLTKPATRIKKRV